MKNFSYLFYIAVIVLLTIAVFQTCGPSKKERDAKQQVESEAVIANIESNDGNTTATYYNVDSCEYFGRLNYSPTDFLVHNGNCPHCQQRQVQLIDSLIKKNLREFFAMEKR